MTEILGATYTTWRGDTMKRAASTLFCAWILWAHWASGPKSSAHDVLWTYDTRAECEAGGFRFMDQVKGSKDRFVCLPDTIDPRGHKPEPGQ